MTLRRFKAWMLPLCAACLLLSLWMVIHSLSGAQLAGCGAGSACDEVMGSRWAWVLGGVPVSLPAAVVYALLLVCVLFLDTRHARPDENRHSPAPTGESLNPLLWRLMPLLAGCIVGAALWFAWLQIGVLHAFCKYCSALHLLGCVVAAMVLWGGDSPVKPANDGSLKPANDDKTTATIQHRHSPTPIGESHHRFLWFGAGLLAAALFAFVQTRTLPDAAYDSGRSEALLPTFAEGEVPALPPSFADLTGESPGTTLTLLFDFQCTHCRRLHRILPELLARSGGQYRIQLCPVPLSSACNPYIPSSGIDRFAGSCTLTRCALAVWYARPEAYATYWDWLLGEGDPHAAITPDEAEARARALLGDGFAAALQDPRIDAYLRKVEELFGRTSSSEKSGVPRFILGQRWLVPETDDPDTLLSLLHQLSL